MAAAAVFLRSLFGTLALVVVLVFVVNTTMGFAGWIGTVFNPVNAGVPIIVMTIALAHSIHIVTGTLGALRRGMSRDEAIADSLRNNLWPVFLTTITTAIGFLSLNASDSPPFHVLGNLVAFGVLCAFVYSLTLLPALLSMLPLRSPGARSEGMDLFDRLGAFVVTRRTLLLGSVGILALVMITGIPRIELTDNWTHYFDERYEFRRDTDFVVENLSGMESLEYSLHAGREGGITDPEYLRSVDAFAQWFREQPEVTHVQAFPDIMKRLNKNMHGDDPAFHRLPDDPELAAQYLLLYELSLPFGSDLNNRIDIAKSATRMSVVLRSLTSKAQRELDARALAWLAANAPDLAGEASGVSIVFAHLSQRNIESMLRRHDRRHGLISLILVGVFRSVRLGLISLVPNFLPLLMSFGLWGYPGRPGGPRRFGGHRDGVRDHRGRHHPLPEQVPRSPSQGPSRARGGALLLPRRGTGALDHHRGPGPGISRVRLLRIRGELGAGHPRLDNPRRRAPRRLPPSPASPDGPRSQETLIRAGSGACGYSSVTQPSEAVFTFLMYL